MYKEDDVDILVTETANMIQEITTKLQGIEVDGISDDGLVVISVDSLGGPQKVSIDPKAMEFERTLLEESILSALRNATQKMEKSIHDRAFEGISEEEKQILSQVESLIKSNQN